MSSENAAPFASPEVIPSGGGAFPAIDNMDPGPAGFTGSLIVAEFPSLQEAEAWIKADPFYTEGVYAKVVVKPYRKALP